MTPDHTPDPTTDLPEPPPPRFARRIALFMLPVLAVPLVLIVGVFPLMWDQTFETIDELSPGDIQSLRVHVLNRDELDGGPDIGPYIAAPADYAVLLQALTVVPEVPAFNGARGPVLGEYRVVLKNGRKGTVRLYWSRPPTAPDAVLRFKIGAKNFEGGATDHLIAVAKSAEARGKPTR